MAETTTLTVGPDDFPTREEVRSFLADSPRPHSTDYGETTVAPAEEYEDRITVETTRLKDLEELLEHDEFNAASFRFEEVYGSKAYLVVNGGENRHWADSSETYKWGGDVAEEEYGLPAGGVVITKTQGNLRIAPGEAEGVLEEWGIEVDDAP